jgi:type IV pilus assembly protein PilW
MTHANARRHVRPKARVRGLTLVELMVAMVVGLLIVLAAVAAFTATRRSASTVDAASQLRDDARFATDLIQRLVVQAGFEDVNMVSRRYGTSAVDYALANDNVDIKSLQPAVFGRDNAIPSATDPLNSATTRAGGSLGYGSDVLILQYQTVGNTLTASDGSMIVCDGTAPKTPAINRADRSISVLYVNVGVGGEPALTCMTLSDKGKFYATPLIKGVENFQVLYGVDNVTPGAAPTVAATSVPNRYVRASELTVAGNEVATYANWRRVRSIRIGLVLRGPPGSAQASGTQTLYPLGGSNFASPSDPGSTFSANDSRLRQVVTFTVQLRNCQNQGFQPASSTAACDVVVPS